MKPIITVVLLIVCIHVKAQTNNLFVSGAKQISIDSAKNEVVVMESYDPLYFETSKNKAGGFTFEVKSTGDKYDCMYTENGILVTIQSGTNSIKQEYMKDDIPAAGVSMPVITELPEEEEEIEIYLGEEEDLDEEQ